MRRRDFIALLGGAAAAWPLAARAQHPAIPVIGYLSSRSPGASKYLADAFRKGLGETGFVEGQNVAIDFRYVDGQFDRLPALAADLVARRVSVIFADSVASVTAAKAATASIPIVFQVGADPVAAGMVASLSRPGGNVTGVTNLSVEVAPKRLELMHELIPGASDFAMLVNPANPGTETIYLRAFRGVADSLGLKLQLLNARNDREIDEAFATLPGLRTGGLVIEADAFFTNRSEQLAALALRHAIPSIYQFREFAAAGGLMSYGGSITDSHRAVGVYVGRILRGEKPADLPVQQSTKVELIINLRTAKIIGITVPLSLVYRADEVIE
jgi:putative ABC transport system substrate-binding protein